MMNYGSGPPGYMPAMYIQQVCACLDILVYIQMFILLCTFGYFMFEHKNTLVYVWIL